MEILQARILEWFAMPFSRGSSQPRDRTWVSSIADGFFTTLTTREALYVCLFICIRLFEILENIKTIMYLRAE